MHSHCLGHPSVKIRFLWARWEKELPVGRSGFFFFLISLFLTRMYRGEGKKKIFFEKMKKKVQSAILDHPAGTQETTFYLRVALFIVF